MNREMKTLQVTQLVHAPWNPRSEAELSADHPEMQKLVASVREVGVLEPVICWDRGCDDQLMTIAGNRRLAAAIIACKEEIQAVVYTDITEAQAREITRIENEIRIGIDPLKDAELISSMMNLGYDQKEIAAHFGVSEATVCRRAKLEGLVPAVREIVSKFGNITTHALEQIALYPEAVQNKCASDIERLAKSCGEDHEVKWNDLRWTFSNETRRLKDCKFDTAACLKCPKRTGSQPDLWGDVPDGDNLGECLDCGCFFKKDRERIEKIIRAKVGDDVEIVDALKVFDLRSYECEDSDDFTERRTKAHPSAYWFFQCEEPTIFWGVPSKDYRALLDKREEEEKAERKARESESAEEKAKREAEEAERKKVYEDRLALENKVDDQLEEIVKLVQADRSKVLKAIKEKILKSINGTQRKNAVAEIIATYFSSYDVEREEVEAVFRAFPDFAKSVKMKPDALKKIDEARKALADFEKKHPKK